MQLAEETSKIVCRKQGENRVRNPRQALASPMKGEELSPDKIGLAIRAAARNCSSQKV